MATSPLSPSPHSPAGLPAPVDRLQTPPACQDWAPALALGG